MRSDSHLTRLAAVAALSMLCVASAAAAETHVALIRERLLHANQWRDHVMVVAHRAGGLQAGKKRFAENSLAALENAVALGAEMVEVDVQKSKDGEYVVLHDTWLDRTTNCRGPLVEKTLAELKTCRLVIEGSGRATEESVPTLREFLAAARGRVLVNIDNKLAFAELAGMVEIARKLGMAGQLVIKQNLWSEAKIEEARALVGHLGSDAIFMPIIADDAVRDARFLEAATRAVAADAVELIHWRDPQATMTPDGGPLFTARARAVAARGDWHLWVNTYAIVNKTGGMLSGGRGDELAVAGLPQEVFGFWAEEGVTIIQTDEPEAAIRWLAANGYRIPYPEPVRQAAIGDTP
jgi:glycerophosphoryl diester phosphodiesterase